jgi:hypothetical protein
VYLWRKYFFISAKTSSETTEKSFSRNWHSHDGYWADCLYFCGRETDREKVFQTLVCHFVIVQTSLCQLTAVQPAYDQRVDYFAPERIWGDQRVSTKLRYWNNWIWLLWLQVNWDLLPLSRSLGSSYSISTKSIAILKFFKVAHISCIANSSNH